MNVEKQYSFKKLERLCGKTHIARLHQSGFVINKFPLRFHILKVEDSKSEFPVQVVINASKRGLKKAVQRNLMKRRLRELYRYNKKNLYLALKDKNVQLHLSIVYYAPIVLDFWTLEKSFYKSWKRLMNEWPEIIAKNSNK